MKTTALLFLAASLAFAQTAPKDAKKPASVKAEPAKAEAAKIKPANKVALAIKADAEKGGFTACKSCKH